MHKAEAVEQITLRRLNLNKILLKCSESKEGAKGVETLQVASIQDSAGKKPIFEFSLLTLSDSDSIDASKKDYIFLNNLLYICSKLLTKL